MLARPTSTYHGTDAWRQSYAFMSALIASETFAGLKQTENSRKSEGWGGEGVTSPLVLSLRYAGKRGGRGKLEVSQQRPIRAALPPTLPYGSIPHTRIHTHTGTLHSQRPPLQDIMPGPCGCCASTSRCVPVSFAPVRHCGKGRNSLTHDNKK